MAKIRVLVVEDSMTVRKHLVALLTGDARFDVVGEAGDGRTAVALCERLRPDVVTLDMIMPEMSGLAATEQIMAHWPTPIVIVSSSTNRGELVQTYDALRAGAVDVFEKPTGQEVDDAWERRFLSTVEMVSRIKVITHLRAKLEARSPRAHPAIGPGTRGPCEVVGVGVSTGGPAALTELFSALPRSFPIPILLVIHIAEPFGLALSEWLTAQTGVTVRYARHGEALMRSSTTHVYMAPPNRHLVLRDGRLLIDDGPERHSCRPSVDVLFESLALRRDRATACLLTGMGRDGAEGLLAVRRAGGLTIAQDEATSVVFGMPREAAILGAAEAVLPIDAIAPLLARLASAATGGEP